MMGLSVLYSPSPLVALRFLSNTSNTQAIPADYWPIGVVIVIIGSFCGALGDVMVRKAFIAVGETASIKKMLHSPLWVVGMVLTAVLDPVTTLAALLFAPATVVTPFAGMHIFWGCFLAKFWLKEQVGYFEALGSGLIILGIVLVIVFAGKGLTYDDLPAYLQYTGSPQSIVYMVVCGVLIVITAAGSFDCVVHKLKDERRPKVQRVCLAACSGLIGGNTNIAAKAFSVAASSAFTDVDVWTRYSTYVLFLLVVFFAVSQLVFLNKGLRRFEAIYIVPTTNSFLITGGTVGSIMVLQEYPKNWAVFFFGLGLVVLGVTILSYQKSTMWKILTCGGVACKNRQCGLTETATVSSQASESSTDDHKIQDLPFKLPIASPDSDYPLESKPSVPSSNDVSSEKGVTELENCKNDEVQVPSKHSSKEATSIESHTPIVL